MSDDEYYSPTPSSSKGLFPTTRWTIVRNLSDGERRIRFPAWDEFVTSYRKPLEYWLVARCRDPHLSEELVQSFLAKMSSHEHALNSLDPSKGRLRSWLLVCLKRHWLDNLPKSFDELPDGYADADVKPDEDFDGVWARSVAQRVVRQLRSEYASRKRVDLFDALLGVIDGAAIEERTALHVRFGMTANTFDQALARLRERLALRLREEVAATLVDGQDSDVDDELRHLILVLGRNGGFAPESAGAET
ncbi:sigma-70 family RNA polymerase sigma factor [Akkermansiaceae bacterium]|nr:sigma-70 family RNA polymerase sigma factor [Akkermansiaceae bacterium]